MKKIGLREEVREEQQENYRCSGTRAKKKKGMSTRGIDKDKRGGADAHVRKGYASDALLSHVDVPHAQLPTKQTVHAPGPSLALLLLHQHCSLFTAPSADVSHSTQLQLHIPSMRRPPPHVLTLTLAAHHCFIPQPHS